MTTEPTYDSHDLPDALESTVMALLRTPQIRQALHDLLRTYGIAAQSAEVIRNQHDQIQALSEVISILLGRQIEHDRRSVTQQSVVTKIFDLVQALTAERDDPDGEIAQAAANARQLIDAAAGIQIDLIESEAARARMLLGVAQSDARANLADALATAQTLRETADAEQST